MSILSGSQRPTEIQVSPSMALACSQRWLPPSTCNSKGEVSSPSIQPPPPVVPTLATTADVQSSSSLLPSALSTTACSPTNSPFNTRFLAPPQEIAECKQPVVSQLMGHQSSSRFTSHHLPNSPTINETSQPAGSEAPFQESPSQISFHESPSQSISCSHLWDTRTSDTPNSPAPTTATSTIRPFRMRRLVRTLFEAAALEYASALRTALLFPSATSSITTATTTPSCDTSPTTQKHLNQGRWKAKCGNESIQRPTQPVKPIFHPVPTSPPPTPVPPTWAAPRSWEQGDSIAQDIQEIRCQFDPVTPSLSHQQQRSLSHQPRASLSIPTPTPGRRYTKCAVTPCKNAQISGRTRHARPLFRGGRRRDQWTTQEVDEEDEWIDVEEVSPPRTTYHLYRMGADGTKCTLPITVMSTDRTPVMSQLPITPSSPSRRPITTLTPSQGPITTLTPSQRPVTTPTLSHRAITTLTPSNRPTLSLQMIRDRRSVVQRQPLPHKSTIQHQRYSTVSRPSSIHHQDRAPTGTSQRHVVSGSSYSKLTVLKIPVTRTQQSKMTVNKEALGHERDVLAQKVVVGPERDTDGDDVQVIPNTQPVTSHFIILSSDSSPEPVEKEDPIGTSSGKEESYRNSTSKHVSNETFSGRKDNLMQKVSSDKNADVMNVLILSDDDDELPDLNRSLPPASPIREKQILEPQKACQSLVGKLEVRCDDTKKDTAVTDSNYLSDASTIIFEDDFDVDMLEENSKDKFSGEECKNAEAFHKTIKTAGNTAAHASALSADELPQRDNKKTEVPNFKLLQTSSDEPESSPMMETEELEIIRSTDKKQVDTVLINKIHTLRLVFSDFIHLNTFPCPLKHSQTNVVDKHQESADGDTRNQFSEFGKTKFADNIKIRDDESTEILGQPRKHDNYVVSRGLEQYRQGRESSLEHKDAVRLLKEDSLNMPESLNVTLQGRISSEAKARDLAKGNSTNENNADYCEFTDVSSIIFVSDGQLIFPVHVLSVSQQQRMQVSPAEEVGIIHQCVYSGRACDAGAALSGNIEMSDSHVSEVRKREISIPENKSLGDDTQTFKKKDVILFKKDGTSRDKMTYGDYKSVQEQKPKEECKLIQKYKTFKETCNSEIEKDPVQGTKVNILINDGSLNESKASKSSPTHFENKSISSSYNEQTLTTTLTDVTCKNSFETCETPSVDNLKEQLDSTKEIVRSLNNVLEVQKISESQESQNPSLEKEELLKSKLENDGLERKETTNLQKPQVSGMKSQEKPDPHILQNDVLVDHSLSESLRVTHQPVPESLCVAEKNTRVKYQVVEMQERLEKPGVKKNQGTSVSPSQPKVVLENMDLLRCETSARGSTLLTTSEDGVAKHEELDTVSASTEIKTQPLWYQRYRSSIIQGLVEELRIMGEREMKFTLEERTTFTKEKDSGDNDKSRKIIMKEGRKMEESTSVVLSEGNIKERTVNVLDEGKINECITVVLNEGKRDDCTAVLDERNMKDCAVNVLEEGEIKECITIVLNKGKMEECTTIVSNDWKKTEEGQTKLLQLKTYESELRGKSSILPQMNGKLFFIPQMNRKSPIVSQLNEDKEKQRKSIPYLKPIVTNTIKMATIGSIDKKCDITEKEPHTVHVLTKNNVVEQEVEFIRKVNVAHTQTADIQSERDRIDKNGLPLAFKGQYNESATNVSEMTELPVTAVKTDNEREKKCKKNENKASDQRISQVRELENVQNTVDGKDNNDVRLPAIQKETIINKNEDQSDDRKYCSRVSKLKDNETRDCSIPRSYQTEESSRRINKVGDKPAMNEYQFKTIDVYVKDIAGESKTITPGQLLQSEKMIENSKTSVKEKTGENENERENEDTTSKVQGASPEGPLRVSSRLVTVKHDSVATSVSPSQSSISSLSDFVKRISQKIDQLKVKTKSTVMDAERYQHSHKRPREFDSTLEDFITRHRQAEEGKQAVHKRVLSPVSSEARKINSCGKPNDVGKSEVYSSRCKQETRYIEDAKRCEEDDKSNTLLSASVPSHPSDTESSNSNAQQHSSDCQISASDIKQSVHSQQLLRSGTLPSQNNTQPSTSNESSSANGVRPVDIDAEVTQTKKDDKDFGTTENSGKEGGSTTITCSEISNKISSGNDATVTTPNKSTTTTNSDTIVNTTNSSSTTDSNITQTTSNNTVNISNSTATVTVVTSSASGSTGRARKRRREKGTIHYILEVPLNEVYKKCVDVVRSFGEKMVSSLRSKEVVGHNHSFSTLQPDYTRSLLNQIVRTRKGPYQPSSEEDKLYRRLLTLHGLVKAADLFCHYGFRPAIHCLQQFQICHQALIPGCYNKVLAGLQELEGGADLTHPKVRALQEEMARARHRGDPNDAETKVLVVARRESQWVREQLGEALGADTVALLSNKQGYHQVLKLLESRSVVVWSEDEGGGGGESLQQLPCSQFSLVVEWEAAASPSSTCVHHCTRQNIPVVSFTISTAHSPVSTCVCAAGVRVEEVERGCSKKLKVTHEEESTCEIDGGGVGGRKGDIFTLVASSSVTTNAELHYILTSIYDINLVERCLRDVVVDEDSGVQAWADLLLDERTCVVLQPLHQLRTDAHLHQLTCQLVLLSLQVTTCYLILYSHPPANSGYVFRSGVVKAMARLVATCALFRSPDYTVSLLLAHNLHQVGELIRKVAEATMAASTCWDKEEWITRPWLTSQMSSHERVLLSLPCVNSITAQVILTAMSLTDVLTLSLPSLLTALPWIPHKVVTMLYKLLHGDALTDSNSYDLTERCVADVTSSPNKGEESVSCETMVVAASEHKKIVESSEGNQPEVQTQSYAYNECKSNVVSDKAMYSRVSSLDDQVRDEALRIDESVQEGSRAALPTCYIYDNPVIPAYNTGSDYSHGVYSGSAESCADDSNSLNPVPVLPTRTISGSFNAREYLSSVTSSSSAGTSFEYQQQMPRIHQEMLHLQQVPLVQQISYPQQQSQVSQLLPTPHQYQLVSQSEQLLPHVPSVSQQHQPTIRVEAASQQYQAISHVDQSVPQLRQPLQLQQPLPQMQRTIVESHQPRHQVQQSVPQLEYTAPGPHQPVYQLQQPLPQLQQPVREAYQPMRQLQQQPVPQVRQSTSRLREERNTRNYYPQEGEESLVVSPYFPEVHNVFNHPAGTIHQVTISSVQQNYPNMTSASDLAIGQYSDICLQSSSRDEMVPLHSLEALGDGNVSGYGAYCGNVQQQRQHQQHCQQPQELHHQQHQQEQQQQKQQHHHHQEQHRHKQQQQHHQQEQYQKLQQHQQQHQQEQHHQQKKQQGYWKDSSFQQPLTPRANCNKIFGIAKPYNSGSRLAVPPSPRVAFHHEGSSGTEVQPSPRVTLRPLRQDGSTSMEVPPSPQITLRKDGSIRAVLPSPSVTLGQDSSIKMSVPPSPLVTLRQNGRGHDFPEDYDFTSSQVRGSRSSQFPFTQEVKKVAYQKVPGRGGQTQLIFQPI